MGFFGKLFFGTLAVGAVLIVVGGILRSRRNRNGEADGAQRDVTENVADLNDRFNRARYMDKDGE